MINDLESCLWTPDGYKLNVSILLLAFVWSPQECWFDFRRKKETKTPPHQAFQIKRGEERRGVWSIFTARSSACRHDSQAAGRTSTNQRIVASM